MRKNCSCISANTKRDKIWEPTSVKSSLSSTKGRPDAPSYMWTDLVYSFSLSYNGGSMTGCWVLLQQQKSIFIYEVTAHVTWRDNRCSEKRFLRYVLTVVPPRTWWVSLLWHCSVALGRVKFLSDRTACVELVVSYRLSYTLLSSVQ